MSSFEAMKRFGFANRIKQPPNESTLSRRAREAQDVLYHTLLKFESDRVTAMNDTRLSDAGKAEKVHEAAKELRDAVQSIDAGGVGPIRMAREEARHKLTRRDQTANEPGTVLRELAVLADLRAMKTSTERYAAIEQAVKDGDAIVYAAFANAPAYVDLMPKALAQQLHDEWSVRRDPEVANELRELNGLMEALDDNIADVGKVAVDHLPPGDPREHFTRPNA